MSEKKTTDIKDTPAEEKIFDAALDVFAEKGKGSARMQEIANKAGLNKALLHYYYRSKDKLYDLVLDYVHRHFLASMGLEMDGEPTVKELLEAFITHIIDFHVKHPRMRTLVVRTNLNGETWFADRIQTMMNDARSPLQFFMAGLQRGIDNGEIRDVDPVQVFITIMGSCIFFFVMFPTLKVIAPSAKENPDQFIAERKKHIFDVIYAGIKMPESDNNNL